MASSSAAHRPSPRVLLATLASWGLVACAGGSSGPDESRPAPPVTTPPARTTTVRGTPPAGLEPIADTVPGLFGIDLDTVRADVFDQGKMWTFEYPPTAYLQDEYGFAPDSVWYRHARLAALRIPGCSASFVSSNGLVLTNHHCAREAVTNVTREGEDLHATGFFARSLEEERPVEDFHADQLIEIVDVSEEVDRRLANAPASSRSERREEIHTEIADRLVAEHGGEDAGIVVEVISLYSGARTSAYVFKRYDDVRLVMAPETQIGFFGGDPDNFTYPRYNLDFSLFRVLDEQGNPLTSDTWFRWSSEGVEEGDLVFVIGNPGSTSRLETLAQLLFKRDVSDLSILDFVRGRAEIFEAYAREHPDEAEEYDLQNVVFGLRNSEKAYQGQLAGLADPVILARLRDREESFQDSIRARPDLAADSSVIERMAELQEQKRAAAPGYASFLALTSAEYSSPTLHRALLGWQWLNARRQAAPISVRNDLRDQILAITDKPAELDEALMQDRFQGFVDAYGLDSEIAVNVLDGRSPEGAASFVRQNSALADSAGAARALEAETLTMEDPAIQIVQDYLPAFSAFQRTIGQVGQQEENVAERIGRARYAIYGTSVPPDATFSLRLADGVVEPYAYNGTLAPVYTTFYGLYDRHHAHEETVEGGDNPWDLPERWLTVPEGLDLSTPLNFISTADIIGGNSGSPVVNRNLEVVGVVFDGNIESLPGDYIYLPESNRSVTVDARGILEALDDMYDMDRIVLELQTGTVVDTEEEADRRRR